MGNQQSDCKDRENLGIVIQKGPTKDLNLEEDPDKEYITIGHPSDGRQAKKRVDLTEQDLPEYRATHLATTETLPKGEFSRNSTKMQLGRSTTSDKKFERMVDADLIAARKSLQTRKKELFVEKRSPPSMTMVERDDRR